jgi:hypothetical protein
MDDIDPMTVFCFCQLDPDDPDHMRAQSVRLLADARRWLTEGFAAPFEELLVAEMTPGESQMLLRNAIKAFSQAEGAHCQAVSWRGDVFGQLEAEALEVMELAGQAIRKYI